MPAPDSTALFLDDLPPFAEIHKTLDRGLTLRVRPSEEDVVAAGTNVLQQPPLVVLKCSSQHEFPALDDIVKAVRSLDEDDRRAYDALDRISDAVRDCDYQGIRQPLKRGLEPEELKIIKVWVANVKAGGPAWDRTYFAVYRTISRVNHSCSPNCVVDLNPATNVGHLRTLHSVAPSEELTIAYTNILDSRRIRQRDLRRCYGFKCTCWACDISEAQSYESDDRRRTIQSFAKLFHDWGNGESHKAAELVARFVEIYREDDGVWALERIWLEQADALALMVTVFAEHSNYNHTATFARAAADRIRIEFGAYDQRAEKCDRVALDPTTHERWGKRKIELFAVNGHFGCPVDLLESLPEITATPPPKKKRKQKKKKKQRKQIEGTEPKGAEPDSDAEPDSPVSANPYPTPPKNALEQSLALALRRELPTPSPPRSPALASALSPDSPLSKSPNSNPVSPQPPPSPAPSDHSPDAHSRDTAPADDPAPPPSPQVDLPNSSIVDEIERLLPPCPSLRPAPSPELPPLDLDALPPSVAPPAPTYSFDSPTASQNSGSQTSSVFHDASESPTQARLQLPASPPPEPDRSTMRSCGVASETQVEGLSQYSFAAAESEDERPATPSMQAIVLPEPAEIVPPAQEHATLAQLATRDEPCPSEAQVWPAKDALDLLPSSDDLATPMSTLAGGERASLAFGSEVGVTENKETIPASEFDFDCYPAPTTLDYFSSVPKSSTPPVDGGLRVRTPLESIKESYEQRPVEELPVEQPQPSPAVAPNSIFPFPLSLRSHLPRPQSPLSTGAHTAEPVGKWRRKGWVSGPPPLPDKPAPLLSKPPAQPQSNVQLSSLSSKLENSTNTSHVPITPPITPPRQQADPPSLDPRQEKLKNAQAAAILKMEKKLEKKLARAQNPAPPLAVNSGLELELELEHGTAPPHADSLAETLDKVASTAEWLPTFEADRIKSTFDRMRAESYPAQMPLSAPWTLCYLLHSKETHSRSSYSQDRTELFHSTTVPDLCGSIKAFHSLIGRLPPGEGKPSGITTILRNGSSLSFFRDSITPTWEDSANKRGGRIMILPKVGTFESTFWDLVLLLAGSSLEAADRDFGGARGGTVVGLVASCRRLGAERIEIWVNGPSSMEAPSKAYIDALKDALVRELRVPDFGAALFKKHN